MILTVSMSFYCFIPIFFSFYLNFHIQIRAQFKCKLMAFESLSKLISLVSVVLTLCFFLIPVCKQYIQLYYAMLKAYAAAGGLNLFRSRAISEVSLTIWLMLLLAYFSRLTKIRKEKTHTHTHMWLHTWNPYVLFFIHTQCTLCIHASRAVRNKQSFE